MAENRPQVLKEEMRNWLDHDGRPWMTCRFCMTISGSACIRRAMLRATKQLARLPWYSLGTRLDDANNRAPRCINSKPFLSRNAVAGFMDCAACTSAVVS